MMIVTSSAGKPTVSRTITIVIKPACGIPAAPIEAAVAVTLQMADTNEMFVTIDEETCLPDRNDVSKCKWYVT